MWEAGGTGVFTISTFELLVEASARVADFSSNMKCLLYRDDTGLPGRFTFGDAGGQALATADPPLHEIHRRAVFPELVTKRMEALDPEIRELADGLVTRSLHRRDDRVHERHRQRRADHDDQPTHRVSRAATSTSSGARQCT